jgi:hypothetical protein
MFSGEPVSERVGNWQCERKTLRNYIESQQGVAESRRSENEMRAGENDSTFSGYS